MRSKLYLLPALLSVAAAFAAPGLAVPSVTDPNWNAPADGGSVPVTGDFLPLLEVGTAIDADSVEIFLDGNPIDGTFVSLGQATENGGADTNDWELELDTSNYTPGAYKLRAVARNGAVASNDIEIDVTFTDLIDPAISSYSPVDQSDVNGSFTFAVTATDNVAATSATWSLDGTTFAAMTPQGGGVFTATVDVSAEPNGGAFLYTEVSDAAGNATPGNVGIRVANPEAPTLNTADLYWFGSTQVGAEGMQAGDATATGTPAPTVTYSWRVCQLDSCNTYAGATYNPIAADVGRSVELVVRASNGVDPQDTEIVSIGTVTAAAPVTEPTPEPTPTPAPEPTPTPAPTPAPVAPTPVSAPPVAVPPVATPEVTVLVNRGTADQKVSGTAGSDRIVTGSGKDVIRAGAGNDVIVPGKGRDLVYAGPGNDVVYAQHGAARVNCGTGKDVVFANRKVEIVGCEKIVVASNNKLVTVKSGADRKPVMPADFVSPFSKTAKAPSAVVAAEQKAVVAAATATVAEQKAVVATKASAATAKLVVVAEKKVVAATSVVAAAAKAVVVAKQSGLAAKLAAATNALVAAKGTLAVAKTELAVADKQAVVATTKRVVASKGLQGAVTKLVGAAKVVVTESKLAVAAEKKVVVAAVKTVAEKQVVVAKRLDVVKKLAADVKQTVAPAAKKVAQERLVVATKQLATGKKDLAAATTTRDVHEQKVVVETKQVVAAEKTLDRAAEKLVVAKQNVVVAKKLAAAATSKAGARKLGP